MSQTGKEEDEMVTLVKNTAGLTLRRVSIDIAMLALVAFTGELHLLDAEQIR